MAVGTINLLAREMRGPGRLALAQRFLGQGTLILLFLYILTLAGLGASLFFFSRQRQATDLENSAVSQEIAGLKNSEGLLFSLRDRLTLARAVFAQTGTGEAIMANVLSLVPSDFEILEVEVNKKGVTLTVRAPNSVALSNFLELFYEQNFSSVTLSSITSLKTGGYAVTLEIK